MSHCPYAFERNGTLHICADGPELLVYEGNGTPRWKAFCGDLIQGVAVTPDRVVTAEASGTIVVRRALDGQVHEQADLGGIPTAVAATADGLVAAATESGLFLVERAVARPVDLPGGSALGFGADRQWLGAGTTSGAFCVVSTAAGSVASTVALGAPVTGVAWSPLGYWAVVAGNRLFLVAADGASLLHTGDPQPANLRDAVVSHEGGIVSTVLGMNEILAFEMRNKKAAGRITFRRDVGGIGMGPRGSLGIGLDDGDASVVDLFTGGSTRTEPHPGRGRNNWNLKTEIDYAALRGAVTFARSGGGPVASFVYIEEEKPRGWGRTCGLTCGGCALLSLLCGGLSGVGYLLHHMGYF